MQSARARAPRALPLAALFASADARTVRDGVRADPPLLHLCHQRQGHLRGTLGHASRRNIKDVRRGPLPPPQA
eukprot:15430546-Alexandrium_andersonii.AAC.1